MEHDKKTCSFCLELVDISMISYCSNCLDAGNTCHNCELIWTKHKNDPNICTICKETTKQNVSDIALTQYLRHINSHRENIRVVRVSNVRRGIRIRLRIQRQYQQEIRFIISIFVFFVFLILGVTVLLVILQ